MPVSLSSSRLVSNPIAHEPSPIASSSSSPAAPVTTPTSTQTPSSTVASDEATQLANFIKDKLNGNVSDDDLRSINSRLKNITPATPSIAQAAIGQLSQTEMDIWAQEAVVDNNGWLAPWNHTLSAAAGQDLANTFAKVDPNSDAGIKIKNSFTNIAGATWGKQLGENKALNTANRIKELVQDYANDDAPDLKGRAAYARDITNGFKALRRSEKEAVIERLTSNELSNWGAYSVTGKWDSDGKTSSWLVPPVISTPEEGKDFINALFSGNEGLKDGSTPYNSVMKAFTNITEEDQSTQKVWGDHLGANKAFAAAANIEFSAQPGGTVRNNLLGINDSILGLSKSEKETAFEVVDPTALKNWASNTTTNNHNAVSSALNNYGVLTQAEGQTLVDSLFNDPQQKLGSQSKASANIQQAFGEHIQAGNGKFMWNPPTSSTPIGTTDTTNLIRSSLQHGVTHDELLQITSALLTAPKTSKETTIGALSPDELKQLAQEATRANFGTFRPNDPLSEAQGQFFVDSLLNDKQQGLGLDSKAYANVRQAFGANIQQVGDRFVWKSEYTIWKEQHK